MRIKSAFFALAALGGLTACGDTIGEQALIGGVAGAGVAAVTDSDIGTGALVGAVGNVAICQTDPDLCD